MKREISLKVNGKQVVLSVEPRETLLEVLREHLGLTGAKLGCDIQVCGTCTVLLDGKAVSSCSVLALDARDCEVTTIEGLASNGELTPLQEAFIRYGALQCGYCTPGMIIAAKALLDENPHPTREQIELHMAGNLCRCGCYKEIVQAIQAAAGKRA